MSYIRLATLWLAYWHQKMRYAAWRKGSLPKLFTNTALLNLLEYIAD